MTEAVSPLGHASSTEAPQPPRRLTPVLAALVLVFAFLAASFAARNSDFWLHLATGRLLAQGEYQFGTDPFAYTTEGVYWANHAWLFDLALYAGHQALGGGGLVALKAIVVAVLAGLMLLLAEPGPRAGRGPFWIGGGCVLLAVLAMSPRLLLQPAVLSFLLLAVCLGLLRTGGRSLWAVPAVIALWVNLDSWFLLGPLLVALYGLGQRLGRPRAALSPLPLWLFPACAVACLVSPHHVHALALPAELSPAVWRSGLRQAPFAPLFASPWQFTAGGQLWGPSVGLNLSAWAYFVLLFLGVISFALNRGSRRDWRLPVWLVFGLLGAWQARLVPFFAVVAGPITALNLRETVAPRPILDTVGRAGVMLAGLVLLALTWPGWLQGTARRDRPLAWAVHTSPDLRRVAGTLSELRESGAFPAGAHSFAGHPDVAHYCAWFCPEEKSFLDSRLTLFVSVASDYQRLRQAPAPGSGWQRPMREHNIGCLVHYDPDLGRLAAPLRNFASAPQRWPLLRVAGQAVIVGRKEGAEPGRLGSLRFDAERLAFAAAASPQPAPGTGPPQLNRPLPWWHLYLDRPSGSTWEAGAAAVYLLLFEESAAQQAQRQYQRVLARHAAGLVGLGALPTLAAQASRFALGGVFLADVAEQPPALPLLAVRLSRRAIAAHPDDAGAWLVLARAYLALGRRGPEATRELPPLAQVRYIQAVTALEQAVTLRPGLAAAHEALAQLYTERQFLDLALQHRRAQLRLARTAGPLPGEDEDARARRLDNLEQAVEQLLRTVQDSENRFVVRSHGLAAEPLARARLALQLGLAGKALDVLLRSHADLYGVEGIRLLLDLLLLTGRAQDARDLLDRDEMRRNPNGLGIYELPGSHQSGQRWSYLFHAYDWFDLCQSAAAGHYDRASVACERLRERMKHHGEHNLARLAPTLAVRLSSEMGLGAVPGAIPLRLHARREELLTTHLLSQNQFLLVERADLHALEAMLLLERGGPVQASEHFRRSLALYPLVEDHAPALPGRPLALRYLELLKRTR
jgi:tetratricopeptide (TPR) repeat protein